MNGKQGKKMPGCGAVVRASVDEALRMIKISCVPLENAIEALSDYLSVFRKVSPDENILILEVLEITRYQMRKVYYCDDNPPMLESQENNDMMVLPVVLTYHYIRILQRAAESAPAGSVHEEARKILATFIAAVDAALKSRARQEYDEIKNSSQADMNYLYIRYLDYMYECFAPEMKMIDLPTFFTLLCKQIMCSKEYTQQESEYIKCYRIYEYDDFLDYCDDWLERNYEDDIFLEDIIMDMGYPKCGMYRNFTYE